MESDALENSPAPPFFGELLLWRDAQPHGGAWNMAADEWLLQNLSQPLLRVYQWTEPAVSFGYFQLREEVASLLPAGDARPLVRRWTGGGLVEHGNDQTYSLIVPVEEPFCRISPKTSYCLLHTTLAGVLQQNGEFSLFAQSLETGGIGGACFQNPVAADVVDSRGHKIAGAAQRRTKAGLLHQGSMQFPLNLPASVDWLERLAALWANKVIVWDGPSPEENQQIMGLAEHRYSSSAWLDKR